MRGSLVKRAVSASGGGEAVVALGVEDGIVVAVVASVIDHLRHSYNPSNHVLVKSPAGYWQPDPVTPGAANRGRAASSTGSARASTTPTRLG